MISARLAAIVTFSVSIAYTQVSAPVGLVTEVTGTSIARAGLENVGTPAYKGDLLFPGDTITQSASGRITFSFCPTSVSFTIGPGTISIRQDRILFNGKTAAPAAAVKFCKLPDLSPSSERDIRMAADRLQTVKQQNASVTLTPEQQIALAPLTSALAGNSGDLTTILARAIAAEAAGAYDLALQDYQAVIKIAPQAHWAEDEMASVRTLRDRVASGEGKTLGVVIGISTYPKLGPENQLRYADRDAQLFYSYLISRRGGARATDVALLLNEQAKSGDVKIAFANAFAKAKKDDRVVIFIASHGLATIEGNNRGGYIMTYDSSEEELGATAIRMEDLNDVIGGKLRPQQIQMFVDACYSGFIGDAPERHFKGFLADFLDKDRPSAEVLGLLASGQSEPSYECSNLDSGHGAFTYFVVHGLNADKGESIDETRGQITVDSLFEYVHDHVRQATKELKKRQSPEKRGNIDDRVEIAKKEVEGLQLAEASAAPATCESARGIKQQEPARRETAKTADPFLDAIRRGQLLPGVAGGAFELLKTLERSRTSEIYYDARNRLLAALLDAGQEVILQYLKGEQAQMTRDDFTRGEQLFAAAELLLSGGDPYTSARRLFCKGRRLIFEKDLPGAIANLQDAIRLDVFGAYSYNALGIAFLEDAQFPQATSAFLDAVRLAPKWAYARHNLALAYTQNGQYTPAIATYQQAMLLGPEYSYIPFNLGLLFERLNRPAEARELWKGALQTTPTMTRAWNAIGLSYFLERRYDRAEASYRTALPMADNAIDRLAVRHNLALLLVDRSRLTEALELWKENLKENPDDLPSLVGLSNAQLQEGDKVAALGTLSHLVEIKPRYTGAQLEYARLLIDTGNLDDAAFQLESVLKTTPDNAAASEALGDLRAPHNQATAAQLYKKALGDETENVARRRLQRKIASLNVP